MIQIYRFFYLLLKVFVIVLKPVLNQKTQNWIRLRSALQSTRFQNLKLQGSIWFHASSGEIEYAKTLIRELKAKHPDIPMVVTYSSESAEKLFENIRNDVDHFIPLPWDDVYSTNLLIKKIDPQILIIARTDLWPELIEQSSRKKVKIALISYYPKLTRLNRFFLRGLLQKIDSISCVDEAVRTKLQNMGLSSSILLTADGDTRFDQVFARLAQPAKISFRTENKIFVFGSTWPEDEMMLFPLIAQIIKNGQHIIFCPHDVSEKNLKRIESNLNQKAYSFKRLSQFSTDEIDLQFPVLLVDRIGVLADVYRKAHIAFVGGSFKSRVHSVMEPLACGVPVLTGPHIQNSPEALKYKNFERFLTVNENSQDLIKNYLQLNAIDFNSLSQNIKSEMQKNVGASQKIAQVISGTFLKS